MDELIETYLSKYKQSTRDRKRRALENARERLGDVRIDDLEPGDLERLRESLSADYAISTVNTAMSALRGVLSVAHDRGVLSAERYRKLREVLKTRRSGDERAPLNTSQKVAILNVAKHDETPQGMRDQAIIALLLSAQWTPTTIAEATLEDLPLAQRHAGPHLDRWLDWRDLESGLLFYGGRDRTGEIVRGKAMSRISVYRAVKRRAEQAGFPSLTPQQLRLGR